MVIFQFVMLNYQRVTTIWPSYDRWPLPGLQHWTMASSFAHGHLAHGIPRTDGNRWEQMDGYISSTRTQYPHSYHSHTDCPVQLSHLNEQKHLPSMNPYQPCLAFLISFARLKRLPSKLWRGPTQRFAKVHDNRASKKAGCRNVLAIFAWIQTNYGDNGQRLDHFNDCPQSNAQGRHDQRSESRQVTESGRLRFWAATLGAQTDRF